MFKTPHDTIALPDSRLAYWRLGTGPDLLLIHGWPLHSATFRNLLPTLSKHFTCHLIDLPGAGLTEVHDVGTVDLGRHATTVIDAVDALGLKRYAMLAHDSGGMIARAVAAACPERVTGLVLSNTEMPGYLSSRFKLFMSFAATGVGQRVMAAALRSARSRRSRLLFGSCFDDVALVDGEFDDLFLRPLRTPSRESMLQFELLRDSDGGLVDELCEVHARVACPVQMIWGKTDPWFPLAGAKAMLPTFSGGAELVVLDGKLFVHEEHPEQVARHASDFLRRTITDSTSQVRAA